MDNFETPGRIDDGDVKRLGGNPGAKFAAEAILPTAMAREQVRVALELNADDGAICGTLAVVHGERQSFHGWLELAAALERARSAPGPEAPPVGPGGPLLTA